MYTRKPTFVIFILASLVINIRVFAQDSMRIQYTGRLFGYYRIEPQEVRRLKPVEEFLKMRHAFNPNPPLLLGMGDNFAPEMGASLQLDHPAPCKVETPPGSTQQKAASPKAPPKSLYKQSDRYAPIAECDNVVRFLLEAGYRAVVPGREDFTYSSTWLHQIGVEIQKSHTSNNYDHQLKLLAANIRLNFGGSKLGCPLFFSPNLSGPDNETCAAKELPARLDWLSRLDRVLDQQDILKQVQGATAPKSGTQFGTYTLLGNATNTMLSMLPSTNNQWPLFREALSALAKHDRELAGLDHVSQADTTAQRCLTLKSIKQMIVALRTALQPTQNESTQNESTGNEATKKETRNQQDCTPSNLARDSAETELSNICSSNSASPGKIPDQLKWEVPLCTYGKALFAAHLDPAVKTGEFLSAPVLGAGREALLRAIAEEQRGIGYTEAKVVENGQMKSVLIVGVAGQETMAAISRTYLSICVNPSSGVVDCEHKGSQQGTVVVMNPVRTLEAILRATEEVHGNYDYRILMAQMPQTEAIELVAHLNPSSHPVPQFDVVLSETQSAHSSEDVLIQYQKKRDRWENTPVLTPVSPYQYDDNVMNEGLVRPDSTVSMTTTGLRRSLSNINPEREVWSEPGDTALHLLMAAVEEAKTQTPGIIPVLFAETNPKNGPLKSADCLINSSNLEKCRISVIQFLLQKMQQARHSDLAVLERRDIFLDMLPKGYDTYDSICPNNPSPAAKECRLTVALDRVMWKGDYAQTVMVTGKDIANMMATAALQSSQEDSLQQQDISEQWLVTFGIVTQSPQNLTRAQASSNEFSVPIDNSCNDAQEKTQRAAGGDTPYCVNGQPLLPDHAYSLAVTDYIAQAVIQPKEPDNYYSSTNKFATEIIEERILDGAAPSEPVYTAQLESHHQQRRLVQIDIAKVVAGYNFKAAQGGDSFVASTFQGVNDARASSPSQSELDLETKIRALLKDGKFNFGIQSDSAYDRSVQGNLTGAPVNAAYPLNNATIGGFIELKITTPTKRPQDSPIAIYKIIVAPFQYQRQINGNYLFFAHTDKTKSEQILHQDPVNGFSHRAGFRAEISASRWFRGDKGSYYEIGSQLAVLNNILSAVTLSNAGFPALTCPANSSVTILNCFKNANFLIAADTIPSALQTTLHSTGFYWDVHYQKGLLKLSDKTAGANLIIDSKGDYFLPRGANKTLSTQTLYDVPLSVSLAFPVFRNLSLGPTYSAFFYGNQVVAQRLFNNGFGVTARWYLDRDASVGPQQIVFKGPASTDETKTAHIK